MTDKTEEQQPFEYREELDKLYSEGHLVDEVYEMNFKGRKVHGLSAEGYFEIAQTLKISVLSCEPLEIKTEANTPSEYIAFLACAQNLDSGIQAWGVAQEPTKDAKGKTNQFAGAAAATKASRNAIQKLVPLEAAQKFIDAWIERGKKPKPQGIPPHAKVENGGQKRETKPVEPPKPPPAEAKPTEQPKQDDAGDKERLEKLSTLMDTFRENRESLNNIGIDTQTFWDAVREEFGAESRDQLTTPQIEQITKALNEPDYPAEWIQDRAIPF